MYQLYPDSSVAPHQVIVRLCVIMWPELAQTGFPSPSEKKGKESAAMKADLLRARDMKRYINQLTVAKKQCEKRIRLLGGPNYENSEEGGADDNDEPQSQKVNNISCN